MSLTENTNSNPDDVIMGLIKSIEGTERLISLAKTSNNTQSVIDLGVKKAELEKALAEANKSKAHDLLGKDDWVK